MYIRGALTSAVTIERLATRSWNCFTYLTFDLKLEPFYLFDIQFEVGNFYLSDIQNLKLKLFTYLTFDLKLELFLLI